MGKEFACVCCTDSEDAQKHQFDYLKLAQNNYAKSRNQFMEHLQDLRVMSLLSTQVDEKIKLFDRVKQDCTLIENFTIPLYYFEKDYIQLLKNKNDNLQFLEIYNNISNVRNPETTIL